MKSLHLITLIGALPCLVSCQTNGLYFATGTQVGVELGVVSPNEQAVTVGYKRAEGVTMPTRRIDGTLIPKAYPVLSIFDLKSGGFNLTKLGSLKVKQVFATGKAANQTNAGKAVGDTMRELLDAPEIGLRGPDDTLARETIIDRLEFPSSDATGTKNLGVVIATLGLPANSSADDAIDAVHDKATPAQIQKILKLTK